MRSLDRQIWGSKDVGRISSNIFIILLTKQDYLYFTRALFFVEPEGSALNLSHKCCTIS